MNLYTIRIAFCNYITYIELSKYKNAYREFNFNIFICLLYFFLHIQFYQCIFSLFLGDIENRGVRAKVSKQFKNFNKLQPKKSTDLRPLPTQVSFTNLEMANKKKEGKI